MKQKSICFFLIITGLFVCYLSNPLPSFAATYYIAPDILPNGTNNPITTDGTGTLTSPFRKFATVWGTIKPGDTLELLSGTYLQTMEPTVNGTSSSFITIKANVDGEAIIDGERIRPAVVIGKIWDNIPNYTRSSINPYGNYFNVEGLVAKNSSVDVYQINARNVNLKRCSGYNANNVDNYHVITVWSLGTPSTPANVLVEDCIAAGSGRKMILAYESYVNVIFRRNIALWQTWNGSNFCQDYWPQSDGIEIYPKAYEDQPDVLNNSIVENNILFGLTPNYGFSLNPNPGNSIGNGFYGDMALGAGMKWDNAQKKFVSPQFNSTSCSYNNISRPTACSSSSCISFSSNSAYRSGFGFVTHCSQKDYITKNNTFQDLFSYSNASVGLSTNSCGWGTKSNNNLIRATIINNGIGTPAGSAGSGTDATSGDLSKFSSITDSKIEGTSYNGAGARLQYRYVNGALTTTSLWPWPMEDRLKKELADPALFSANGVNGSTWTNFSITTEVCEKILKPNGVVTDCSSSQVPTATPTIIIPTATLTPSPTPNSPSPTPKPGDLSGDGNVTIADLSLLLSRFGQNVSNGTNGDFSNNGKVDIADLSLLLSNFGR